MRSGASVFASSSSFAVDTEDEEPPREALKRDGFSFAATVKAISQALNKENDMIIPLQARELATSRLNNEAVPPSYPRLHV
jgi:hypothetical protein